MKTLIDRINELFLKDSSFRDEQNNLLIEKIKTSVLKMDEQIMLPL